MVSLQVFVTFQSLRLLKVTAMFDVLTIKANLCPESRLVQVRTLNFQF